MITVRRLASLLILASAIWLGSRFLVYDVRPMVINNASRDYAELLEGQLLFLGETSLDPEPGTAEARFHGRTQAVRGIFARGTWSRIAAVLGGIVAPAAMTAIAIRLWRTRAQIRSARRPLYWQTMFLLAPAGLFLLWGVPAFVIEFWQILRYRGLREMTASTLFGVFGVGAGLVAVLEVLRLARGTIRGEKYGAGLRFVFAILCGGVAALYIEQLFGIALAMIVAAPAVVLVIRLLRAQGKISVLAVARLATVGEPPVGACAMHITVESVLVLAVSLLVQGTSMGSSKVADDVASLVQALKSGHVSTIQILHIPYEAKVRARIDSALLLRTVEVRCEIVPSKERTSDLVAVIEQSMIREAHENADIRWGLLIGSKGFQYSLFLDGKYITGTGRRGTLNGTPVVLNGTLVSWLEGVYRTKCSSLPI